MSGSIPFEIHEENNVVLPPTTVGTDHSTVGSFTALIIIGHITMNLEDSLEDSLENTLDGDYSQHRQDTSTITIPTQLYCTTSEEYNVCPICMENFVDNDEVVVLDCAHVFHGSCIHEWGHYKGNCPICRTDVQKENPDE